MPHSYVRLDDLTARAGLNIRGSTDRAAMLRIGEAVAEQIDRITHRHFYSFHDVRLFDGNGKTRIPLRWDIARVTTLKEDDANSGSFSVTFSSSDFVTWPYEADSTQDVDHARPITRLEINTKGSGTQDVFQEGRRRYQLTGVFGYTERVRDTGSKTASSSFTASSTKFTVTASTRVSPGDTVLIGSEQLYVVARSSSADAVHVMRAANGTTAAAHSSSATIQRYVYPAAITQAALMQTSRLWARRENAYADNAVGLQESGQAGPMVTGLDNDVKQMISPYIRPVV